MNKKNKLLILFGFGVLLFFPTQLFAYLDPGSLSYIASIIIGALVGILMYIKIIWAKIIQLVHKMKNRGITNEDD